MLSGVTVRDMADGPARFVRLSDLSDAKAGREPRLVTGEAPSVARALTVEEDDLIVGARGIATDVCVASDAVLGAHVSLDLYLVRPNANLVNAQYLAAFLELPSTQALLASGKQGTGLPRLAKEALEKIEIPLPAMDRQRLIAKLAQSFEHEGRLLNRLAELNVVLAREALTRVVRRVDAQYRPRRSAQ